MENNYAMDENDKAICVYNTKQEFLTSVRQAFRVAKLRWKDLGLSDDEIDDNIFILQDDLSLFSPWMSRDQEEDEIYERGWI